MLWWRELRVHMERSVRFQVHALWRQRAVRPTVVLYEAFGGTGLHGDPAALFRALDARVDLGRLRHVWAVTDVAAHRRQARQEARRPKARRQATRRPGEPRRNDRVRLVRRGSLSYHRYLATSGYLVSNAAFPAQFAKRTGQTYLHTGVPLQPEPAGVSAAALRAADRRQAHLLRNLVMADFLVSPDAATTESVYRRELQLGGIYRGQILEIGGQADAAEARDAVIDVVFGQRMPPRTPALTVRRGLADGRTSVLIHLGGMKRNGITASALNLLQTIDHDRFDVSVVYTPSRKAAVLAAQNALPARVRRFRYSGSMNGRARERAALRRYLDRGQTRSEVKRSDHTRERHAQLWRDEFTRCFGDSCFDHVIDFSGYGTFWATLLLHSPPAERSIWLHNDLAADAHREGRDGQKKMLHGLTQIFSMYADYDTLVSVSPELALINQRRLAPHAPADRFRYAPNTIDACRVLGNAGAAATLDTATTAWAERILSDPAVVTFITVGRLSPEKNQARLIRSFARVHADTPATRLVIVGRGPLRAALTQQIADFGLQSAVFLTGELANPHALLAVADAFVLSSDYEGQPMVILEALVLGMPVITVAFESVPGALPPGVGRIVAQTDDALAAGLTAFLHEPRPASRFDHDAHNRNALEHFALAIGAPGRAVQEPVRREPVPAG